MTNQARSAHSIISPAILYWGTPIVLVTTENEDGTSNIAPMSSAFWLGRSCVLGLGQQSKTYQNLFRTGECVLNLPDDSMLDQINALADTTGLNPVPDRKATRNYVYVQDKWTKAELTAQPSAFVRPDRIAECPVQMECRLLQTHRCRPDAPDLHGAASFFEVLILRIYVKDDLRMAGHANRIDPDRWRPMIMSFQEIYGLSEHKLGKSVLGRVSEELYRGFTKSRVVQSPGDADFESLSSPTTLVQPPAIERDN